MYIYIFFFGIRNILMQKYNMLPRSFCLIVLAVFGAPLAVDAECPNVIRRSSWVGKEPKNVAQLTLPLSNVIIHHTVTRECLKSDSCSAIVRNIQTLHMDNFLWDDIGYSFLIGGDGNVYEGRGWNRVGAHTYGWNIKSIGIAFIGTYSTNEPSQKMLDTARELIACGKDQNILIDDVKVFGARQFAKTLSPGDKLYSHVKTWPEWSPTP